MLGKKTIIGLIVAVIGVAIAILFGVQAEKSTKCDPSEMSHSATTATDRAYEEQANRYCSHPPADEYAVPAGLGVVVAIGGVAFAAIAESRRRKLVQEAARRATLAYEGYQATRAAQRAEREAQAQAEAEAAALADARAQAAVPPPPPAPAQEFAGAPTQVPVYDYPAPTPPAPVEDTPPPPPAPSPAPSPKNDDPFGGLFS